MAQTFGNLLFGIGALELTFDCHSVEGKAERGTRANSGELLRQRRRHNGLSIADVPAVAPARISVALISRPSVAAQTASGIPRGSDCVDELDAVQKLRVEGLSERRRRRVVHSPAGRDHAADSGGD